MTRLVLEQVTDFGDFTSGTDLNELLRQTTSNNLHARKSPLSDVRVSPDGRHIHVILRKPKVGLVTFDKYQRPKPVQNHRDLDVGHLARTVPIVDVVYLTCDSNREVGVAVVAVVFENGKAEFWTFVECRAGWHLLQTSDLCNSPRARVVSVSACSNLIIWCEERPPSESSPVVGSTRNNFRYCVCKRAYEVEEGGVSLGGVKIALHNNPRYTVISSGETVYLLPDLKENLPVSISQFFLSWSPQHDTFKVNSTCKGTVWQPSAKESDFKRLLTDCLGYLSSLDPPGIYGVSPVSCGGLLLLLSTGWVSLLQKDGILRQVFKLTDNCSVNCGVHNSLHVYQETVAVAVGRTLHLIDLRCGKELERISLKREGLLYGNRCEKDAPHLLSDAGLFVVMARETDPRGRTLDPRLKCPPLGTADIIRPGALLVEAVFEEACKFYQQRSLSSTQLTVDKLKKGGMFQAPISLASILREYFSAGGGQKGAEPSQGGGGGGGAGQDKLRSSIDTELKGLVSLEELKGNLIKSSEKEVGAVCESLVHQEVARLFSCSELDKEAVLYLNTTFTTFPSQAWRAVQTVLHLSLNGENSLSSKAAPEVWKTILSPIQTPKAPANLSYTNGQPKHKPSFKPSPVHNGHPKSNGSDFPAANPPLPVFELLCQSVLRFQPSWLPRFLQLAQQQQGSSGLGLGLASSSWGYSGTRGGGESGESSLPLYKRALSVLPRCGLGKDQTQELEVELLLVSRRPNAILQALRVLMGLRQWERVTQVAQGFSKQSPLLNKEIFTTLLCEVAQHRELDPYLDLLWALCPDDITVTAILNLVLKNIPSPNPSPSSSSHLPSSSSSSFSAPSSSAPAPFVDARSSQLTIGLLKPLLSKVLQRETKPSRRYADILQSPSFPPQTQPRQPVNQQQAGAAAPEAPSTDPAAQDQSVPAGPDLLGGPPEPQQNPSKHRTNVEGRYLLTDSDMQT